MLFSAAKGHKVVSTGTADTVGRVKELVVDPASRSVVALRLRKTDSGNVLAWSDLTGFGTEAVTVSDADRIGDGGDLQPLLDKRHRLVGKRVLTAGGDELGSVADVDFDLDTGSVTTLLLKDGADVAGSRLLGVGSYAVVVRSE
ncbi:MAG: PRC-barrel domain-containing protein [Nocardioidaceae bacterium]